MSYDKVNPCVARAEYAVRGFIVARSEELKKELASGVKKSFDSILQCNIGNPQAVGHKPFTFHRLVMSLVDAPMLLDNPNIVKELPSDVVARAREILKIIGSQTGAYTSSNGYEFVRKDIAQFITERDRKTSGDKAFPVANPNSIVLTDGSSACVRMVFPIFLCGPQDACMIPIPQYPLYTATLSLLNTTPVPYQLCEKDGWSLKIPDLEASFNKVASEGVTPRILVVINPGNPTGSVLECDIIEQVIKFSHAHKLLIIADEVYQDNVYISSKKFHSFREVLLSLPAPFNNETMLISMHSVSKGLIGECGRRGGYFERLNIPRSIDDAIVKMISINLCSNVNGQVMMSLMCRPPQPSDASFEKFDAERTSHYNDMAHNARLLTDELNKIPGFSCNCCEGAMYSFAKISIPEKFIKINDELNKKNSTKLQPDTRWCADFLEESGIVVIPGSGFGQEEGTWHFRTTILPPITEMKRFVSAIEKFNERIMKEFA